MDIISEESSEEEKLLKPIFTEEEHEPALKETLPVTETVGKERSSTPELEKELPLPLKTFSVADSAQEHPNSVSPMSSDSALLIIKENSISFNSYEEVIKDESLGSTPDGSKLYEIVGGKVSQQEVELGSEKQVIKSADVLVGCLGVMVAEKTSPVESCGGDNSLLEASPSHSCDQETTCHSLPEGGNGEATPTSLSSGVYDETTPHFLSCGGIGAENECSSLAGCVSGETLFGFVDDGGVSDKSPSHSSLLDSSFRSTAADENSSTTREVVTPDSTSGLVKVESLDETESLNSSLNSTKEVDFSLSESLTSGGKKSKNMKKFLLQSTKSIKRGVIHSASRLGKPKAKQEEEATLPSCLMSPVMTQNWDPTCLLEELYMDVRPSTQGAGEMARYSGYLEKLPKKATKASVMKGWKRRYFRLMDSKVYYYEDRNSTKALGFVRLSTSGIVLFPEKNQIQIQERKGQSIMMRALDKEDMSAWHRALLLEVAHPTVFVPDRVSPLPDQQEVPVLIIDIGAASVRAGFSGSDAYPEMFFPAVTSFDSTNYEAISCGTIALLPDNRLESHQVYPRREQLRMDRVDKQTLHLVFQAVSCIIDYVVSNLNVKPETTQLILTAPPTIPEQQQKDLVQLLFEGFNFSAICFQDQTLLSLYSYNTTSGIVVNIGDHIDVVPIIDGYTLSAGRSSLPHGGNTITENLSKLITMKGIRYFSETEMYIVRLIKEELCYISQNYDEDLERCESKPATFTSVTDVDHFQLPDHCKIVALDVECFKAPEGLFQPGIWGKDVPGLHDLVWNAIQACPVDNRKEMARKIYLSGSTTLLPHIQERLQKEVSALATSGLTVEVHAGPSRQHAAFLGASVLASLGSFQNYLITREEFNAEGFDILKKWKTF